MHSCQDLLAMQINSFKNTFFFSLYIQLTFLKKNYSQHLDSNADALSFK